MSLEGVSVCEAVIINDAKGDDITNKTTDEASNITDISPPPAKKAKYADERLTVRFVKTSANAHAPTYGSTAAAGADLYSADNVTIPAKGKYCVTTDLQVELPFGYYGRVAPRSGLAAKNFIDVGAGVVDSDYRGVLKVLLFNFSDQDFEVKVGDRIAQFICERIAHCNYVEVQSLEETQRGAGGFGSTGV